MSDHESIPDPTLDPPAHAQAEPEPMFSLFAAFRISSSHPVVLDGRDVPGIVQELEDIVASFSAEGVALRGWYDVSGLRSDADLMVWLTGSEIEDLQWAFRQLRRCALLRPLIRVFSTIGAGPESGEPLSAREPAEWLACATARIPDEAQLPSLTADDGVALSVFDTAGLADTDWLIAVEAEDPVSLSGLVRALGSAAPVSGAVFTRFTGRYIEPAEIVEVLQ